MVKYNFPAMFMKPANEHKKSSGHRMKPCKLTLDVYQYMFPYQKIPFLWKWNMTFFFFGGGGGGCWNWRAKKVTFPDTQKQYFSEALLDLFGGF